MDIINPATEKKIMEIQEDDHHGLENKFRILKEGQPRWAAVPLSTRIDLIREFHQLLEPNKGELAASLTAEMGKPIWQSMNELKGAQSRIQFFTDQSQKWLAEEWINREDATREKIAYEPLGVIANISAWNYPYLVGMNVIIPALIGGNSVMYKPSEFSTLTGRHIARLLYQAGVPENAFQVAVGKGAVGEYLLGLPMDAYFFTGSYKTGKSIAERVASKLVPVQLELGGKDPLYVMDDLEDIHKAAGDVLEGVVYNSGQSCCAVERIYVHANIYDRFIESYAEQSRQLKVGDPMDPTTQVGPLSRKAQVQFLQEQISDAVGKGAKILAGGRKLDRPGYFVEPTVLVNVNHSMNLMKDESFGPIVGIQKVESDEEAIRLMLDSEYGLTAAVYSRSFERAEAVMKKMDTGTVYWNCCDRVSAYLPWSGRRHSGLGTTLSYQGIRAFVQPKAYHIRD
ncbi:MAG: aldehyde dehydrogenase [Bacteroidetes bacterium]|nr:MAG: aldehyde dehydrogenase [Bacteroidota bacterium]